MLQLMLQLITNIIIEILYIIDLCIFNKYTSITINEIIHSDISYELQAQYNNKNLLNYIYFKCFLSKKQRIKQLDKDLEEYFKNWDCNCSLCLQLRKN